MFVPDIILSDNMAEQQRLKTLEGTLSQRKLSNIAQWKTRYVVINLQDGGSLSCYKPSSLPEDVKSGGGMREIKADFDDKGTEKVVKNGTKVVFDDTNHSIASDSSSPGGRDPKSDSGNEQHHHLGPIPIPDVRPALTRMTPVRSEKPRLFIPAEVPWVLDVMEKDPSAFAIEIPPLNDGSKDDRVIILKNAASANTITELFHKKNTMGQGDSVQSFDTTGSTKRSMGKNKKGSSQRFMFKCPGGGNEKSIWVEAAVQLHRIAVRSHTTTVNAIISNIKNIKDTEVRYRTRSVNTGVINALEKIGERDDANNFDRGEYDRRKFRATIMYDSDSLNKVEYKDDPVKEYRVHPTSAYPRRWMTKEELYLETIRTSSHFYDLRVDPTCTMGPNEEILPTTSEDDSLSSASEKSTESTAAGHAGNEIGTLHVEVLQCFGLPKLDTFSKTDSRCYIVCGSHAFSTDTINDMLEPWWPRKARRACIFPLYHAYAQMFVGVFDDDGLDKDDFVGRAVIDICRLRPASIYDVTVPLRLSSYVYNRKKRGAIRLRFRLDWYNERDAILSYVPRSKADIKKLTGPPTTVKCADMKAFRNIALTVHGSDIPQKLSQKSLNALKREFKLYRKMMSVIVKRAVINTMTWYNPLVSFYIFCGWMYCVYVNSMALVPPYVISWILLLLVRNYARYNINARSHWGYAGLTFEEMLLSLMFYRKKDSVQYMEPLEVGTAGSTYSDVKNHRPAGVRALRVLGFTKGVELTPTESMKEYCVDNMEFPFSNSEQYPKVSLEESLYQLQGESDFQAGVLKSVTDEDGFFDDDDDYADNVNEDEGDDSGDGDGPDEGWGTQSKRALARAVAAETEAGEYVERLPIIPEQNSAKKVKAKMTVQEELELIEKKAQKATLHAFDDRVCLRNTSLAPDEVIDLNNQDNEHQKQVGIHLGITTNKKRRPIVARVHAVARPVTGIIKIMLRMFRSIFNMFTWKDPFLSFWACLACFISIIILLVFPWRLFFALVGIAGVGPQNWVLWWYVCKKKNKNKDKDKKDVDKLPPPAKKADKTPEAVVCEEKSTQVFFSNRGKGFKDGQYEEVIIPYSPMMQNRFYDWPPEPSVSRVINEKYRRKQYSKRAMEEGSKKKDL